MLADSRRTEHEKDSPLLEQKALLNFFISATRFFGSLIRESPPFRQKTAGFVIILPRLIKAGDFFVSTAFMKILWFIPELPVYFFDKSVIINSNNYMGRGDRAWVFSEDINGQS